MKNRLIFILFIFTFLLTACNFGESPKDHLQEIYTSALESLMESDQALNSEMKFIAIEMGNFDGIEDEEKKAILTYFNNKYEVETMDATMEELEAKGYYNPDTLALDGILLKVEKIDFKFNNDVLIEGSKFKSGKGAIGVEITVHYKNNEWNVKK